MREELRRSNSIGNKEGISYFLNLILNENIVNVDAIKQSYLFSSSIYIHYSILPFFEEIGLIKINKTTKISLTQLGEELYSYNENDRDQKITTVCINYIIDKGLLNSQTIIFNLQNRQYQIGDNSFPLEAAIFRNFLITMGALVCRENSIYYISKQYEYAFCIGVKKLTREDLYKKIEALQQQGDLGEKYVLDFEKKRLNRSCNVPQIISEIDVSAGFDIVSYESAESLNFDRFIEVKTYSGIPHFFWSKNERRIAEIKGERYYLFIVDIHKLNDADYIPIIIKNPFINLKSSEWIIETNSFEIYHV